MSNEKKLKEDLKKIVFPSIPTIDENMPLEESHKLVEEWYRKYKNTSAEFDVKLDALASEISKMKKIDVE